MSSVGSIKPSKSNRSKQGAQYTGNSRLGSTYYAQLRHLNSRGTAYHVGCLVTACGPGSGSRPRLRLMRTTSPLRGWSSLGGSESAPSAISYPPQLGSEVAESAEATYTLPSDQQPSQPSVQPLKLPDKQHQQAHFQSWESNDTQLSDDAT